MRAAYGRRENEPSIYQVERELARLRQEKQLSPREAEIWLTAKEPPKLPPAPEKLKVIWGLNQSMKAS